MPNSQPTSPTDPLVSVIVPCFNLGGFLWEALDSCLAQSLSSIEVVIVDDGSTDPHTITTVSAIDHPQIRVIRTQNRGLGPARNLGVEKSRGRLLCFLDADDRIHPTLLEKAAARLDAQTDLGFVSCWIRAFGSEEWQYHPESCDLPTLLAECTVATAAVIRRDCFLAVDGFDEAMPEQGDEDWDLWIRLVAAGHGGEILKEVLFDYRRREASMVDRCYYGDGHTVLMAYLFEKHSDLYDRHRDSVIEHQLGEIEQLEGNAERLRIQLHGLETEVASQRALRNRLLETRRDDVILKSHTDLLGNERKLLELRRATRDLEQRRALFAKEKEDLAQEIGELLGNPGASSPE
jgi:glycosyltransferase involved in cell wall biosynthesis